MSLALTSQPFHKTNSETPHDRSMRFDSNVSNSQVGTIVGIGESKVGDDRTVTLIDGESKFG